MDSDKLKPWDRTALLKLDGLLKQNHGETQGGRDAPGKSQVQRPLW